MAYRIIEEPEGLVTYDYRCTACDYFFTETVKRVERDKQIPCPECGLTTKRLLAVPYLAKKTSPLNSKEQGIKKDLKEAVALEETLTYKNDRWDPDNDRIKKEINKLKFTE